MPREGSQALQFRAAAPGLPGRFHEGFFHRRFQASYWNAFSLEDA
jgi:hypothetical protein